MLRRNANDDMCRGEFEFEWRKDGTIVANGGGGVGDDDNVNVGNKRRRTNASERGVMPSHPDDDDGGSINLQLKQKEHVIYFNLPSIQYYLKSSMVSP